MRLDFCHLTRTRSFRAIARLLVFLLLGQNFPASAFGRGDAHAADAILWVDATGDCGGSAPCYASIQSAIDAAASGQTVRVLAGTYGEQLLIAGKNADPAATENGRIVIEADPSAPPGAVVLQCSHQRCEHAYAVAFQRSSFVTLRGFEIAGAGSRGILLRGSSRQARGIHLERNRVRGGGGECLGGIDVGRGSPDTVIANNVVSGACRHGLRFRARSGRAVVAGNTIIRNRFDGIVIARGDRVSLWNNIIALNGFRPNGRASRRYGVGRQHAGQGTPDDDVDIRDNLVCGNAGGELQARLLGPADTGNLTPTGSEGPGVTASPQCAAMDVVFDDLAGPDGVLDSADDDFSLAPESPSVDAGLDPRLQATGIADPVFEADYLREGVRPAGAGFDVGAVEGAGSRPTRTPTPTIPTPSSTGTPSATPAPSPTQTATASAPTTTPSMKATASPTPTTAPSTTTSAPATARTATATAIAASPTTEATGSATASVATSARTAATVAATPTPTLAAPPSPSVTTTATPDDVVANNDHYEVPLGRTLTVPAAGVLANDDDRSGHALTATKLTDPDKGSLTSFGTDGGFSFDAPPTYPVPPLEPVERFQSQPGQYSTVHRVVDVNGDGNPDVIVHSANRFLVAVDGVTGNTLWSADGAPPPPDDDCAIDTVANQLVVGDVDDDGVPEIVQSLRCARDGAGIGDRYVIINARTGAVERITDPLSADPVGTGGITTDAMPTIARLAPDEPPSIIIGVGAGANFGDCSRYVDGAPGPGTYCRVVVVVDGVTGHVTRRMFATSSARYASFDGIGHQWPPPIVFDLDGDGVPEIFYAGAVFHPDGSVAWEWPLAVFRTAIANLDDTPDAEIVMLTSRTDTHLDGLRAFKSTGEELWSFPLVDTNVYSWIAIADVDRDGFPEILQAFYDYGTSRDVLLVLDREGQIKWLRSFPSTQNLTSDLGSKNRPTVYDLDGDGVPEVILQLRHALYFLDGTNGATEATYDFSEGEAFENTIPTVADLDGNGHAEVILNRPVSLVGSTSAGLWVLKGQNDDWRPVQGTDNQVAYYGANVGAAGAIPYPQPNVFANPRTNVFGTQAPYPYLPTFVGRDQTSFLYEATDGTESAPARVSIDIVPQNRPPRFTSTPPTVYQLDNAFTYDAVAADPDTGDTIAYSILLAASDYPGHCSIGATSGVFFCDFLGKGFGFPEAQTFTLIATDSQGAIGSQVVRLEPSAGIAPVPNVVGMQQGDAQSAIVAAGFRVGTVTSYQSPFPAGQVITQSPAGGHKAALDSEVRLAVSLGPPPDPRDVDDDGDGFSENQGDCDDADGTRNPGATDTVGDDVDENCDGIDGVLPIASIVVEPADDRIVTGNLLPFTATAVLTDGTSADVTGIVVWSSSDPGAATITTTGVAHGVAVGTTTIGAARNGVVGSTSLTVAARAPGDQTAPSAIITSPANGGEVTTQADVIGTADDEHFLKYQLAYAPAGETDFTPLASGTVPVTNGVLGRLDPTLLLNDLYDLKLTVFDAADNQTSTIVTVQIAREQKVGVFTLTFKDLDLPLAGVPIVVTRTYDSRDKGRGDFGVGWRLGVQTLRIRANREQGSGWAVQHPSALAWGLTPTADHEVSLTLADGKVETFDLRVVPTTSTFQPFSTGLTASYVARPGTLGALTVLDNTNLAIIDPQSDPVNEVTLLDDVTFQTFDPRRFRYTTPDGQMIDVDRIAGVEAIHGRNGNATTFGPNGITHSSGKSVAFTRDAQGRITAITDPSGVTQTYGYDANGDLVSHATAAGTARYAYDRTHGLVDIQDSLGNHGARNEYDDDGRLVATVDATGKRVEFAHDLSTSREVVTDQLGRVTVIEYDAFGNVVARTDAAGGRTAYTYDTVGNELTETDPLGRVASKTYDGQRNVLTSTDFNGNTTTSTYDARQQLLTTTDQEGRTTTNVYDANGNLVQIIDPDGGTTSQTFDAAGNLLTSTDPLGHVSTFTYDTAGFRTSETDPLGVVTTFGVDANGKLTAITKGGASTAFVYDDAQRMVETVDALGRHTTTTYSAIGDGTKPASSTNAAGQVTHYAYDALGRLTVTTFPDGSTETRSYDAAAQLLGVTDRDGRTTAYEYDPVGRNTKVVNPDGSTTSTAYDAAGRVVGSTDERGNTTTFAYGPNTQTITDPTGASTTQTFDSHGRVVEATDALGHAESFAYDGRGNPTTIVLPDGSTEATAYDAAGRQIAKTDQAGETTQFAYDDAGRLVGVTDAEGGVTTYGWDARGNLVTEVDANGHTTTMTYDALNHLLSRTRPLGEHETFAYDEIGRLVTHVDFAGQTTTFVYDAANQLTEKVLPTGAVPYAFTPTGLRLQAGDETFVYDERGRMLEDHAASGTAVTYEYDAAGNRTSMVTSEGTTTYTYDAANRLATVVDGAGTTTYGYDAVGDLATTAYPNGVTTTYIYDDLNRLVKVVNENANGPLSSYTYTLGPTGNRIQVVEGGPATTGRSVSYAYDHVYRLTQEAIDEPGAANDQTVSYAYDAVGNRTEMSRSGTVTTYAYDADDRVLTETTGASVVTSTYDDNGNLKTRGHAAQTDVYDYDAENRLIGADVATGAHPGVVIYGYDADGMRTTKTVGGVTTAFVLDRNQENAEVVVESDGASVVTYTRGSSLISQTRSGAETRFYVTDGRLSTRQLTDETGAVTDTYTYDAFGVELARTGATVNLYRYTGEQFDPNVGFYYLRARYYAPQTGRFITTDPARGSIFDPVSLHRYLYANANPINARDPSGEASLLESALVLAILAVVFFVAYLLRPRPVPSSDHDDVKTLIATGVFEYLTTTERLPGTKLANSGELAHEIAASFTPKPIRLTDHVLAFRRFYTSFSGEDWHVGVDFRDVRDTRSFPNRLEYVIELPPTVPNDIPSMTRYVVEGERWRLFHNRFALKDVVPAYKRLSTGRVLKLPYTLPILLGVVS